MKRLALLALLLVGCAQPTPEPVSRPVPSIVTPEPPSAVRPSEEVEVAEAYRDEGIASFMAPKYGPHYLALPGGPGITVRICSQKACVVRTSTDAGPDLAMQRAGRVADVSYADFRRLCDCDPYVVGLIRVSVETVERGVVVRGDPTPPATDR